MNAGRFVTITLPDKRKTTKQMKLQAKNTMSSFSLKFLRVMQFLTLFNGIEIYIIFLLSLPKANIGFLRKFPRLKTLHSPFNSKLSEGIVFYKLLK